MSRMREAVEIILAGKSAAKRMRQEFVVDRFKLANFGKFTSAEMDAVEEAVSDIESHRDRVLSRLGS
jgi:hypothetical protein